jgi:myosin heavy subunit
VSLLCFLPRSTVVVSAESDSELQRLKEKMDRLNSDYFETKAEAASLEKQSKETSRQLPLLQEELGDAKLSIGKLTFEVDRLKGEAKSEDAKVEHILKELEEELESEREGRQTLEDESVVIKAQVANLEQIVQQQQTHGRALVAQLESISGVETRASELEDANTRLVTELHSAKAELNAKASEYTETVEMMRTHAQAENERHEQSYEGLVSMLEALKKELYAHTKKEVEMNHELGKKDNRLDDALKQVATLQTQCESLNENSQILKAAVKEAERELAVAREASDETAEAAQIASALGSDTGLMRQLSEARQEVARVKKEAKDARCASPKMGRPGTVDFKVKLQLSQVTPLCHCIVYMSARLCTAVYVCCEFRSMSMLTATTLSLSLSLSLSLNWQAQAQAKTLKIENERLMAELEVILFSLCPTRAVEITHSNYHSSFHPNLNSLFLRVSFLHSFRFLKRPWQRPPSRMTCSRALGRVCYRRGSLRCAEFKIVCRDPKVELCVWATFSSHPTSLAPKRQPVTFF